MNKYVTIDASKCLSSIQRTFGEHLYEHCIMMMHTVFINQFQGDKKALYNPFFFSFECQFAASAILFEIQISFLRYLVKSIGVKDFCL